MCSFSLELNQIYYESSNSEQFIIVSGPDSWYIIIVLHFILFTVQMLNSLQLYLDLTTNIWYLYCI